MTGAQITDAEAARMKPRRVISALMPEGFGVGKEPSIRRRAGEIPLCLPPSTATSHLRGDHLAAEWQVGEGASPRRDAENRIGRQQLKSIVAKDFSADGPRPHKSSPAA